MWRCLEANPAVSPAAVGPGAESGRASGTPLLPRQVIEEYVREIGGPANVRFDDVLSLDDWAEEMLPRDVVALLFVFPINEKLTGGGNTRSQEPEGAESAGGGAGAAEDGEGDGAAAAAGAAAAGGSESGLMPPSDERGNRPAAPTPGSTASHPGPSPLWFTRQKVANACGTVALLHVFANLRKIFPLPPDGTLARFIDSCESLDGEARARKLEKADSMAAAHRRAEARGQSEHRPSVAEHFVAFAAPAGRVVEFDGRRPGPLDRGPVAASFFHSAAEVIRKEYIAKDPDNLRFSLIAVSRTGDAGGAED